MAHDLSRALNTNFSVIVDALPNLEIFLTDAGIPDVMNMATNTASPHGLNIGLHGDQVEFSPLILGFVLDEHWHNYEELFRWVYVPNDPTEPARASLPKTSIYIDVLDNRKVPTLRFEFVDAFPTSLSSVQFDHQGNAEGISSTVEFRYSYFRLKRLQNTQPPVTRRTPMPII